ncbi:MAG: hypothetical protein ACHQUC_10880, partial [Chlamydiales bacterium]
PVRYLYRGREVTVLNESELMEKQSFAYPLPRYKESRRDYKKIALAIVLLVPGLICGIVLKLIAFCAQSTHKDLATARKLLQPFVPPEFKKSDSIDLETFGRDSRIQYKGLKDQVKKIGKEIWKDAEFIQEFSVCMENGYKEMILYYQQLKERHHNDPDKMTTAMVLRFIQAAPRCNLTAEQAEALNKEDPTNYCSKYFFDSITDMYHLARGCCYCEDAKVVEKGKQPESVKRYTQQLSHEDQAPYFTTGTPQYRWRMLYNDFCEMIDRHGLREHLGYKDQRFLHWSVPDTNFVEFYSSPDTTP